MSIAIRKFRTSEASLPDFAQLDGSSRKSGKGRAPCPRREASAPGVILTSGSPQSTRFFGRLRWN